MRYRQSKGFTAVEIVIATTILGLITVTALSTSLMLHRTFTSVAETNDLLRSVRRFDALLEEDVRAAISYSSAHAKEATFVDANGKTTTYRAVKSDIKHFRLERERDGEVTILFDPMLNWKIKPGSTTTFFSLEVRLVKVTAAGTERYEDFTRQFNLRGSGL